MPVTTGSAYTQQMRNRRKGIFARTVRVAVQDEFGPIGVRAFDALYDLITEPSPACPRCGAAMHKGPRSDSLTCVHCLSMVYVNQPGGGATGATEATETRMPFARDFGERQNRRRRPASRSRHTHHHRPSAPPPPDPITSALRVLNLKKPTNPTRVRQRRKELARGLHSDLHGGKYEVRMKEVNAAADYLLAHPGELE